MIAINVLIAVALSGAMMKNSNEEDSTSNMTKWASEQSARVKELKETLDRKQKVIGFTVGLGTRGDVQPMTFVALKMMRDFGFKVIFVNAFSSEEPFAARPFFPILEEYLNTPWLQDFKSCVEVITAIHEFIQ